MENSFYLGLTHYPINNKRGEVVTTSVTNLDIHDISRSCRTFGFKNYFIITPFEAQKGLVQRILGHWEEDKSSMYNPDRQDALSITEVINDIDGAVSKITEIEGSAPVVVVTGANFKSSHGGERELIDRLKIDKSPCLLLFGTGWGLHSSVVEKADFMLEPIKGMAKDGYNHLSVRSAVAIYLDRIACQLRS